MCVKPMLCNILIIIHLLSYHLAENHSELFHVELLFRHGDRSPVKFLSNENNDLWKRGRGQLTDSGIRQAFRLGLWAQNRYVSVARTSYDAKVLAIRSTYYERTIMSGLAFLTGLYNGSTSALGEYEYKWNPVPIFSVPKRYDILFARADCPAKVALHRKQLTSPEVINYTKNHSSMFNEINQNGGYAYTINQSNLWHVRDPLFCRVAHDHTFPDWVNQTLYDEIDEAYKFYWFHEFAQSREIIRLSFGDFIDELIDRLTAAVDWHNNSNGVRPHHFLAFSVHDFQITFSLAALGLFKENQSIPYAAAIGLELSGPRKENSTINNHVLSHYFVRIVYKNGADDSKGSYQQLPFCRDKAKADAGTCPLDIFIEALQDLRLKRDQYKVACGLEEEKPLRNPVCIGWIAFLACLSTLLLLGIILSRLCKIRTRRKVFLSLSERN